MLIHGEAILLAFLACLATNIDNLLLVLSGGSAARARLDAAAFLAVLSVAVGLALMISFGIDLGMPRAIAWVGLIPLAMGFYELRPRPCGETAGAAALPLGALTLTLTANSLDTLLVQTVLFADMATGYHAAALAGSLAAAVLLALCAYVLLSRQGATARLLRLATRARPWILIAVGLLILMDTGFDTQ
jgi:cadmium resistance protein CadD (predicted permease)